MDTIYGLLVLLLLIGFIGMWIWAWSSKRKKDFAEAALLPFVDSESSADKHKENNRSKQ